MSDDTAPALMQRMLRKPLFVVLRTPRDLSRMQELLREHLQWAILAEERGELFASGPFIAEGSMPGVLGGMSILRAESASEVRGILARDPFIRDGVYEADVRRWMLMEGGMTVNVRFSDRSYRLF